MQQEREHENRRLIVNELLVAFGGPDGVGKDAILDRVVEKLGDTIFVVDPDPLKKQFPGQREMAIKIETLPTQIKYALGHRLALPIVEQALEAKKIVIVKRPFNSLMHSIRLQKTQHVKYLERQIVFGRATNGLWPAVWIEITASEDDIVKNLLIRAREGSNSPSDPIPERGEVEKYLTAQRQVLEFVKSVPAMGNVRFVEIHNPRIEDPEKRERALLQLADQVIESLPLQHEVLF